MIQTPKLSPACNKFVNLLPNFSWANSKDIWNNMINKEHLYTRNPLMMSRHSNLSPRMRSILLNWLSEVCEVYQLHRETYYLAMDYFDRYLSIQNEITKQQLQLVGITCLFIASKIEEIYPPKVSDFAYVTDGACTEKEILLKELVILKCLKWNLNSMTVNSWLTVYMQIYTKMEKDKQIKQQNNQLSKERLSPNSNQPPRKRKRTSLNSPSSTIALQVADTNKQVIIDSNQQQCLDKLNNKKDQDIKLDNDKHQLNTNEIIKKDDKSINKTTFISSNLKLNKDLEEDEFLYQKYDSYFFAQIAHLVDLSMLDIGSLRFSYNVISAAALYHFTTMQTVIQCTGLRLDQIQECIFWMTPFALAIRDEGFDLLKLQKHELIEKMPNIQIHTIVDLKLLDKAQLKCQQVLAERNNDVNSNENSSNKSSLSSPLKNSSTILTPPKSISKNVNKV